MKFFSKYPFVLFILLLIVFFINHYACIITLGIFMIVYAVHAMILVNAIMKNGESVVGTVVDYTSSSGRDSSPLIEFETLSSQTVCKTPYISMSDSLGLSHIAKGSEVNIKYDPKNPETFILADQEGMHQIVLIGMVLAGFVVIGIGLNYLFEG